MESHQPYLSFLFLTFLNKQGNFTFLPSVLSPVSKSNIKEVPWNHQNIHNYYSIVWKTLLINQKRVSTFFYPPFSWVLTTRNVWVGSQTDIILKPKSFSESFPFAIWRSSSSRKLTSCRAFGPLRSPWLSRKIIPHELACRELEAWKFFLQLSIPVESVIPTYRDRRY